jgi:hypothetical protein
VVKIITLFYLYVSSIFQNYWRAVGSIPEVGSSSITILGFEINARATLSFRLFPPLKSLD